MTRPLSILLSSLFPAILKITLLQQIASLQQITSSPSACSESGRYVPFHLPYCDNAGNPSMHSADNHEPSYILPSSLPYLQISPYPSPGKDDRSPSDNRHQASHSPDKEKASANKAAKPIRIAANRNGSLHQPSNRKNVPEAQSSPTGG